MALKIMAKLGLDGKGFKAGAEQAKQAAGKMKNHISGEFKALGTAMAGAFAVSYITQQIRETADYAAQVRDLANTYGMSTDHIQKLGFAATQSGIELKTVMDAHKDLGKNTAEALAGVESKMGAFKALGVSVDEIKGKNIDEVFMRVAKAISESGPILKPEQVKAIEDLMGGAGYEAINMMRGDLQEVFAQLEEMGGLIDNNAIEKMGALSDKFAAFETANKGLWADMLTFFGDSFMGFVDYLSATIDILANRLVHLFNMGKNLMNLDFTEAAASAAGVIGGDLGVHATREGAAEGGLGGILKAGLGTALGLGMAASGVETMGAVNRKRTKVEDAAAAAEELRKAEEEAQAFMEIANQRKKIQDQMDAQKEAAANKEFEALSNAEKQLALEQKLLEQRKKLAEMPFHDEAEITMAELNPFGGGGSDKEAQEKVNAMLQANLDRDKAIAEIEATEEEKAGLSDAASAERQKLAEKQASEAEAIQDNLAGKAKFDTLARIGGSVGGRNPVLDMAKKQLNETEQMRISMETSTKCLTTLSGVK